MAKKGTRTDRQERVAGLAREQQRKERRRTAVLVSITVVIALIIVGATAYELVRQNRADDAAAEAAAEPIPGVETFDVPSADHVTSPVDYPQSPPVGGDHDPVWQNCGYYPEPIEPGNGVHSLEHGAVWITYSSDLPEDQVDVLRGLAQSDDYVLVSAADDVPSPIVASAWGVQLQVDTAEDPKLDTFLTKYVQGEQTPELGAACIGGTGEPA